MFEQTHHDISRWNSTRKVPWSWNVSVSKCRNPCPPSSKWGATLLETLEKLRWPLKMDGWETILSCWGKTAYFQGLTIHSREGQVKMEHDHTFCWSLFSAAKWRKLWLYSMVYWMHHGTLPSPKEVFFCVFFSSLESWVAFKHQRWPNKMKTTKVNNVNYFCCLNNVWHIPTWKAWKFIKWRFSYRYHTLILWDMAGNPGNLTIHPNGRLGRWTGPGGWFVQLSSLCLYTPKFKTVTVITKWRH